MLLLSVFLFMGVLAGITINMMASFIPFLNQMNDMQNYYNAYYGAVSAVEQGLLASKYKQAGFSFSSSGDATSYIDNSKYKGKLSKLSRSVNSKISKVNDKNINYLYTGFNNSGGTLNYNQVIALSFSTDNSTGFSQSKSLTENNINNIKRSYTINEKFPDYLKNVLGGESLKIDDIKDINNGWISKTGLQMVTQDNMLYFWLDSSFKGDKGELFPFLEYNLDFGNASIGDKKFEITGKGEAKDYSTELNIEKTTKDILSPDFKKSIFPTKPEQ